MYKSGVLCKTITVLEMDLMLAALDFKEFRRLRRKAVSFFSFASCLQFNIFYGIANLMEALTTQTFESTKF